MASTPREPVKPSKNARPTQARATRVPVALPEETAPEHWLRTFRLRGFTLVVLILIILTVVVLAPGLRILVEQQQAIAALEAEVAERKESVEELEQDVARWGDPAYVKAQARERLYYVFPGEESYIVIDDGVTPTTPNGVPISDEIQTTKVDWVQSLLASVYMAGLTVAAPGELPAPIIGGGE
jgi:cell division protein FtsB